MRAGVVRFDHALQPLRRPPLDLLLYRRDSFTAHLRQRLAEDDPYLQTVRREWNETLRRGVRELPGPEWLRDAER